MPVRYLFVLSGFFVFYVSVLWLWLGKKSLIFELKMEDNFLQKQRNLQNFPIC